MGANVPTAEREQSNPDPVADQEHCRSQGCCEEQEKLVPKNQRIQPEFVGRFFLSHDVVTACFQPALAFEPR